ncbi:3505_t:CDS:1, partial [Racocetra fulgida]
MNDELGHNDIYQSLTPMESQEISLQIDSGSTVENEGISLTSENWITHREETVMRIDQFIQRDCIILIRAPPFTGKTSLCILLEEYYRKKDTPVLQICFLGVEDMNFEEFWINETGKSWKFWLNPKHGERVIILDETHHIFDGSRYESFWIRIKSLCRQASLGQETIKIIAFSTGGRLATSAQSPMDFRQKFGFELVRCTQTELMELVKTFNNYNIKKKINVSGRVAQQIMEFTAGHFGLVRWILNGIDNYFSYRGTNYKVTTDAEIMSYFTSSDFIEHVKAHRGAPLYKFNAAE